MKPKQKLNKMTYSENITNAIAGFLTLTTQNGWDTKLAFDTQYDMIYDEISEEDFINAIQEVGNAI